MEAERTKFEVHVHMGADGKIQETGERQVGKKETFEFGAPDDEISFVVGGGYIVQHNPDFLQKELGPAGACARYYFDKKIFVDIGDPKANLEKRKRKLLFQNGFGYLCIPKSFPKEVESLRELYKSCLQEYEAYEALHPRPVETQEVSYADSEGRMRKASIPAIDIKVGGGSTRTDFSDQAKAFKQAKTLGKYETKLAKQRVRTLKAIRRARENNQPFRNPFIGPGKRLYAVNYGS